jgi:hypothetical protein
MAKIIEAVRDFGPKVKTNQTIQLNQIAAWIVIRTSVNKNEVTMVLQESNEAVLYFNGQGAPVKMDGIGIFKPGINRNGTMRIKIPASNVFCGYCCYWRPCGDKSPR